jgi:hypothetical protein
MALSPEVSKVKPAFIDSSAKVQIIPNIIKKIKLLLFLGNLFLKKRKKGNKAKDAKVNR